MKTVENITFEEYEHYTYKYERDIGKPALIMKIDKEVGAYWEETEDFNEWLKEQ